MLNIQTKNLGTVAVLSLQGQVVIGQTETLRETVQSLPQTSSVILDLSEVSIIDAHGLGVMLQLRERSQTKGVRFRLINLSRPLREVMRITALDSVFQIDSVHRAPLAA
jgi:anti-sigma B factor antagonist